MAGASPQAAPGSVLRTARGQALGREVPSGPTIAAQQQAYPSVTVIYRPPCRTEKSELFGAAPHGVEPEHVVKSLCRALGVGPGAIEVEPDPDARRLRDHEARCYVLDALGARVAHVTGLSFAWIRVEAARLANTGWKPSLLAAIVGPDGTSRPGACPRAVRRTDPGAAEAVS